MTSDQANQIIALLQQLVASISSTASPSASPSPPSLQDLVSNTAGQIATHADVQALCSWERGVLLLLGGIVVCLVALVFQRIAD